jgi:hypothetical protein
VAKRDTQVEICDIELRIRAKRPKSPAICRLRAVRHASRRIHGVANLDGRDIPTDAMNREK